MLAGCAQIFDLDDRAPSVIGTHVRREIRNDASHFPVVVEVPYETIEAIAVLDDGTRSTVHWESDGTFWFPVARWDQPYRLQITADGATAEYQHHSRFLRLGSRSVGRLDRATVPAGTALEYVVDDAPSNGVVTVATTGVWSETSAPVGANSSFTIDWIKTIPLSPPRGLIDAAQFDRAYWIHHDTFASPEGEAYWGLSRYREDDITLAAGQVTSVVGSSIPIDASSCVRIDLKNQTEATRLQNAGLGTAVFGAWSLRAVPAPAVNASGLGLASMAAPSDLRDVTFDVRFGNPFPGHQPLLVSRVSINRGVIAPGAATVAPLQCGTIRWTTPSLDDCATPTTTAGTVGVPGMATLDGNELATDRQLLPIDESREQLVLRWALATDGPVDHYVVSLVEALSSRGTTTLPVRATYVTVEPSVVIDPALFHPGKLYMFSIVARTGFPRSADGDLIEQVYPLEEAWVPTTTFFATRTVSVPR